MLRRRQAYSGAPTCSTSQEPPVWAVICAEMRSLPDVNVGLKIQDASLCLTERML